MPFPVDIKYILETEEKLDVKFPPEYKRKMMKDNGGAIETEDWFFMLHPFFDKSSKKRIKRTCNDIILETNSIKKLGYFPRNGISIGTDNGGNQLILLPDRDENLSESLYFWNKRTGEVEKICNSIMEIYFR